MKTEDFLNLLSFSVHKSQVLVPNQVETYEWIEQKKDKDQVYFKLVEARDLGMHKGYFKILGFIYDRLNVNFRKTIPKDKFYLFLKVTVAINLRGREWVNPQGETKYFNQIQGWRVDKSNAPLNETKQQFEPAQDFKEEEHDDLPF